MFGSVVGSIAASPFMDELVDTMEFPLFRPFGYIAHGVRMSRMPVMGECAVAAMAVAAWIMECPIYNEQSFLRILERTFGNYDMAPFQPDFGKISCGTAEKKRVSHALYAARVEAVAAWAASSEKAAELAGISAAATGGSQEAVRAAQTLGTLLWMARHGATKLEIQKKARSMRYYSEGQEGVLKSSLAGYINERAWVNGKAVGRICIRPPGKANICAKVNLDGAIYAFLESSGFESCIRKAITLGGAREALTAMAGALAAAFYGGVPEHLKEECRPFLKKGEEAEMAAFEDFCKSASGGKDEAAVLHPDAFEVIRCRGRKSVYLVDASRKRLIARLKKQIGEDVAIAEPKLKDKELAGMKGPKPRGTCISAPEPEIEVLYFQDGDFHTPADFYSDDAAPMRERHRAQSLFWDISYDVKGIRRELQEYCGYKGNGCIHFFSAIYPVIGENYIEVRERGKVLGSLCIDQSTGLLRVSEGVFPDGTQTGDIPAADIVRDLCLSCPNKEKALHDVLSSKDPELTGSLQL